MWHLKGWLTMREILGKVSPKAFEVLDVKAKLTFESASYEVWEMSESEYQGLCAVPDKTWNDNWGWWRGANGSVMDNPTDTYTINGVEIIAFDGSRRVDNIEENKTLEEDEQWIIDPKDGFSSLMSYFHHELELSQPRNVTAICIDIAKLNDIKLSELFSMCHVDEQ